MKDYILKLSVITEHVATWCSSNKKRWLHISNENTSHYHSI